MPIPRSSRVTKSCSHADVVNACLVNGRWEKRTLTLSYGRANGRNSAKDCRYKDTAATTKEVIQRIRAPAAEESRRNVRTSIDQTLKPLVTGSVWIVLCRNTKSIWEREICAVRSGLIPVWAVSTFLGRDLIFRLTILVQQRQQSKE